MNLSYNGMTCQWNSFNKVKIQSTFFTIPLKQEKGILIIGIGIGRSVDETELLQIADGKKDNVMKVSRFDELLSKLKDILKLFCASRTSNNK